MLNTVPGWYTLEAIQPFIRFAGIIKIIPNEPEAMENVKALFGDKIAYCEDEYEALKGADALLIVTEWPEFRTPDFERIASKLNKPVIFDGRNLYDPIYLKKLGFEYYSIGRK